MMKVCMLVHQYYYRDPRVQRYAEALAAAAAEVDVLSLRSPEQSDSQPKKGIRVVTIPLGRGYKAQSSYLREYLLSFVLFTLWLIRLHLRNRYDVIHVHNMPDFLVFATLLPRLLGARVILDIHDPMPEVYASKYAQRSDSLAVWLMRQQERWSTWFADTVITANANFRACLIERGTPAHKITVVNNIADPRIFDRHRHQHLRQQRRDCFTVIYPGTIAPRYGLDVAIRALPLLINDIPHICMLFIGTSVDYVDELKHLAEQLGVANYVQFRPAVPVHEVPVHMIQADVGMYPARTDGHMNIATPTKVLEYAAMGIPIVASRLKVLEDMFPQDALLFFEPGNERQFAQYILELYHDPARSRELVQQADDTFLRRYTWSAECHKYFAVLQNLVPHYPAPMQL